MSVKYTHKTITVAMVNDWYKVWWGGGVLVNLVGCQFSVTGSHQAARARAWFGSLVLLVFLQNKNGCLNIVFSKTLSSLPEENSSKGFWTSFQLLPNGIWSMLTLVGIGWGWVTVPSDVTGCCEVNQFVKFTDGKSSIPKTWGSGRSLRCSGCGARLELVAEPMVWSV